MPCSHEFARDYNRAHWLLVTCLFSGPIFFRPEGTHCSDKREIWHGAEDRRCQISPVSGQKCGNTAPKLQQNWNFANKFAYQERLVCTIFTKFSAFVRVYRCLLRIYFGRFRGDKQPSYKRIPWVGAFSHKFSIAIAAKIMIWSKKLRRCKTGTALLYHRASVVGIVGRAPAVDQKVWCFCLFLFFLSRFRHTKFVITETLLIHIIFETILYYGIVA